MKREVIPGLHYESCVRVSFNEYLRDLPLENLNRFRQTHDYEVDQLYRITAPTTSTALIDNILDAFNSDIRESTGLLKEEFTGIDSQQFSYPTSRVFFDDPLLANSIIGQSTILVVENALSLTQDKWDKTVAKTKKTSLFKRPRMESLLRKLKKKKYNADQIWVLFIHSNPSHAAYKSPETFERYVGQTKVSFIGSISVNHDTLYQSITGAEDKTYDAMMQRCRRVKFLAKMVQHSKLENTALQMEKYRLSMQLLVAKVSSKTS